MRNLRGRIIDTGVGLLVLVLANALLDPVPLTAAITWASGIICLWFVELRRFKPVALAAVAGALLGAAVHLFAHVSGRSTAPPEGLTMHVLGEAALGTLIGVIALLVSGARDLLKGRSAA